MSAASLSSHTKILGHPAVLAVTAAQGTGGIWTVAVRVIDVRQVFGRVDYKVEPLAPALGQAIWVDAARVQKGGGV